MLEGVTDIFKKISVDYGFWFVVSGTCTTGTSINTGNRFNGFIIFGAGVDTLTIIYFLIIDRCSLYRFLFSFIFIYLGKYHDTLNCCLYCHSDT
jgi:hypothetical protein